MIFLIKIVPLDCFCRVLRVLAYSLALLRNLLIFPSFVLVSDRGCRNTSKMDGDIACPRCKTTKYRNPSLKLMVNVCGHALCESCVDMLFVKGSGCCPQCNIALRRNNFRMQMFEDPVVEKEVDIRKRILKDYNKREEDFATSREYNDYLEEVETVVYNLTHNIDIEATKRTIEQYKKDNKEQILRNKAKMSKDQEFIQEMLDQEDQEVQMKRQLVLEEEKAEKKAKIKKKEALIDELMFSDAPAKNILAEHAVISAKPEPKTTKNLQPTSKFSTGIRIGVRNREEFLPIPKEVEGPLYSYEPMHMELCGPEPPEFTRLESEGYLNYVRAATDGEVAGGFLHSYACYRALQDAFCGINFIAEDSIMTR